MTNISTPFCIKSTNLPAISAQILRRRMPFRIPVNKPDEYGRVCEAHTRHTAGTHPHKSQRDTAYAHFMRTETK